MQKQESFIKQLFNSMMKHFLIITITLLIINILLLRNEKIPLFADIIMLILVIIYIITFLITRIHIRLKRLIHQELKSGERSISKILVTGSNGTIGTRLCEQLLAKGYNVVGVDWKHNKWNKDVEKITIIGDLKNKKTFDKLPKDVDLIIHLAANALVYKSVVNPDLAFDNITTIYNTLEFARKNNVKKFMFASSREVYGNKSKIVLKEEEAHINDCESPYAASKISGEVLLRSYHRCFDIDFIILRFSNVYGMYDDSDRVIPLFIRQCKNKTDLIVYGADKMLDFTYIDDTVSGVIACIERFENMKNDTVNIAYGQGSSIVRVAELIKKNLKSNNRVVLDKVRTGEVVKYVADISKIKKTGYIPKTNIEEGIKKSIEWYNKNSE